VSWLIAGLLWALTVTKALTRRSGQSLLMLWCSLVFALSFSTDIGEVFQPIDSMLGGWNSTNLFGHLLFSLGVYLLSRSVVTAASPRRARGIDEWSRLLLGAVLAAQVTSFAFVRTEGPSAHFSLAYGTQDAALWYALVEIVYAILILGATGLIACAHSGRMRSPRYRWAMRFIGIGCVLALATEVSGIENVVRIHDGTLSALSVFSRQHDILFGVSGATLVLGFGLPSVAGWLNRARRRREAAKRVDILRPIWETATEGRNYIGLENTASASLQLHRMAVEIRDATLADPGVVRKIRGRFGTEAELQVDESERFLAGEPG
jgi:hypothetical protein